MAENQLIITQGGQGSMGTQGPQGPTTFVVGPTGASGATGIAGVVFPYDVSTGTASFFNIGVADGQFIMNNNGMEITGIGSTAFGAINLTYLSSSQSAAIYIDNVYGASYSLEMTSNNGPAIFNNLVIFAGGVQGASFSGGSTATGPQGAIGPQGFSGLVGPTGPASGWPVDATLVDAQFINIGNSNGSFNMGVNGIDINGLSSSQPASILFSNNAGTSYSLWIPNNSGPIQIDVPITFTNQVISTLYLNSSILFEHIYGGATQAMLFSGLTSSTTAAIQSSGVYGTSYSWWWDSSNAPVQFDCPVVFTGTVSGTITGGGGATGPIGPTGANGVGAPNYYGNFYNTGSQAVITNVWTYSLFNNTINNNGISLTGSAALSPTYSNISIQNSGLYYIEAGFHSSFALSETYTMAARLYLNNSVINNTTHTNVWNNAGGVGAYADYETILYYITNLNAGDILNLGVFTNAISGVGNVLNNQRFLITSMEGPIGATGPAGSFTDIVSDNITFNGTTTFNATSSFNTNVVFNNTTGTSSLVNGTIAVSNGYVDALSLVWVQYLAGVPLSLGIGDIGTLRVSTITPGASFVVQSETSAGTLNVTDNSSIQYWIQN